MNNPLYRPPAEAHSLILQIDHGCPHNRCTFCGMYRRLPYSRLNISKIQHLIAEEAHLQPQTRRIFLADGDAMRRPFDELRKIMHLLNSSFTHLTRISLYAGGHSIMTKTDQQLQQLRKLKLHTLYMGLESGSEAILKKCRKGCAASQMTEAAIKAHNAGLRMSVMILLGLGGQEATIEHAEKTTAILNQMQPRLLSALRVVPIPGTELHDDTTAGRFQQLSEYAVVDELHRIISRLDLQSTVFRANHGSNVIPLEGRLPRDKARLLTELATLMQSGSLDKTSPGNLPIHL